MTGPLRAGRSAATERRSLARVSDSSIQTFALGFQWPTIDPFLLCVHHLDDYPAGNASFGPDVSLAGHEMGSDFVGVDG